MKIITIITRHPEAVKDYFGFGCREVERGSNKFGDVVIIAECPDQHAEWNAMRLGSGLHGARIVDDFDAWKAEWEYKRLPDFTCAGGGFHPSAAICDCGGTGERFTPGQEGVDRCPYHGDSE